MRRLALLAGSGVVAAAMAMPAAACINSYTFDIKLMLAQDKREYALQKVAQLEKEFKTDKSVETTNDLAVARILFGRVDEAIVLLKDLEQRHPGKAETAANLGTAFELAGKDKAALEWIREGIRRDPREHFGSEWIHVRILEAKLALKSDPAWLDHHSVLGLSFGDAEQPGEPGLPSDHLGNQHPLKKTANAVAYQLFERTLLVKPKDRLVADLYVTTGDLAFFLSQGESDKVSRRIWVRQARSAYEGAVTYGDPRTELIQRRLAELERLEGPAPAVKTL